MRLPILDGQVRTGCNFFSPHPTRIRTGRAREIQREIGPAISSDYLHHPSFFSITSLQGLGLYERIFKYDKMRNGQRKKRRWLQGRKSFIIVVLWLSENEFQDYWWICFKDSKKKNNESLKCYSLRPQFWCCLLDLWTF